jgi:hypothetical protein
MLPKIKNSKDNIGTPGLQINPQQGVQRLGSMATVMPRVKPVSNSKKAIEKSLKKTKQTLSSISDFPAFFDFMRKENSDYHQQMENMEKDLSKSRDVRHKEVMSILLSATKNKRVGESKIKTVAKKQQEKEAPSPGAPTKPTAPSTQPPAQTTPQAPAQPPAKPTTPSQPAAQAPTKPTTPAQAPAQQAPTPAKPAAPAPKKAVTPQPGPTQAVPPKPVAPTQAAPAAPKVTPKTAEAVKPPAQTVKPVETVKPVSQPTPAPAAPSAKPVTEIFKETAKVVAPAAAKTVAVGAVSLGAAIAKGESAKGSYNAANMGTKNKKIVPVNDKLDLENTTIGEIIRRQSIKWGDNNENEKLFAVGKYQIIPETLLEAVKKLNISTNEKFSGPLQERMFNEYLLKIKRPGISEYLNSGVDDPVLLRRALKQLSLEWASIADPDIAGGKTSHYGSGNKASMTVEEATALLKADRLKIQSEKSSTNLSNPNQNVGQQIYDDSANINEMKRLMRLGNGPQQVILQQNFHNTTNRQHFVPPAKKQELNPTMQ